MKKLLFMTVLFVGVSLMVAPCVYARGECFKDGVADRMIKPSGDLRQFIGQTVSFTDEDETLNPQNVWNFLIVGTSEHVQGLCKSVVFYVGAVNYQDCEVKQIIYTTNALSDWWRIEYYTPAKYLRDNWGERQQIREENKGIHILSIGYR